LSQKRGAEAETILTQTNGADAAKAELESIEKSLASDDAQSSQSLISKAKTLLNPKLRLVMLVGISVAVLQQITGINAVFFYAPMIFEQSGIGTDASFLQAIAVGLTNLVFTFVAIYLIDKVGRKSLLVFGVAGIAISMLSLSHGFSSATYQITEARYQELATEVQTPALRATVGTQYDSDIAFKSAMREALGDSIYTQFESDLLKAAISMNRNQILFSIIAFVACFAFSLGPVMWVLFSELFPNYIRGLAISFVGLVNSGVSFLVQLVFPWELANLGNGTTFLLYGIFALLGLGIIIKYVPETKGKSLEELEEMLVKKA
jgi:MFS family permease